MRVVSRVLLSVGTIAAHVLVSFRLASGPGASPSHVTMVPVVIAARDFAQGDRIDRANVVVAQWPAGTVPAGAYSSIAQVTGLLTGTPVFRGEAIIPRRLAGFDRRISNSSMITPGKRAMSFRIDDVSAMPGLIRPNSRVDLLVVIEKGGQRRLAKLFMQNVRVLAIGMAPGQFEPGRVGGAVATVEVAPEEGERLAIATTQGRIQLVLRNSADPSSDVSASSVPHLGDVDQGPVEKPQLTPPPRERARNPAALVRNAVILRY